MKYVLIYAALTLSVPASAEECVSVSIAKEGVLKMGGSWVDLTQSQVDFMRGVFAASPQTPDRLPYGASGALVTKSFYAEVVFIDGDLACDPMPLTDGGLKKLLSVGAGEVNHPAKLPGEEM